MKMMGLSSWAWTKVFSIPESILSMLCFCMYSLTLFFD